MVKFRKIVLSMTRAHGYGQYYVMATYRGKKIKAYTTDSECWDWLNDDSDKKKHLQAKRHAYYKIIEAYKSDQF